LVEFLRFLAVQSAIVVLVSLLEGGRSLILVLHALVAGVLVLLGVFAGVVHRIPGIGIRRPGLRGFGLLGCCLDVSIGSIVSREYDGCSPDEQSSYQQRNNGTFHGDDSFQEEKVKSAAGQAMSAALLCLGYVWHIYADHPVRQKLTAIAVCAATNHGPSGLRRNSAAPQRSISRAEASMSGSIVPTSIRHERSFRFGS